MPALIGVMNGTLKFLTARKILPLLDLLTKFKRVLACSCPPNFFVARKLSTQSKFFITARARKKIAVLGMLSNARKDHSSPLLTVKAKQNFCKRHSSLTNRVLRDINFCENRIKPLALSSKVSSEMITW